MRSRMSRHHHQQEAASEETAKYCKPLFSPAFGHFFVGFEGLKGLLLAQRVEVRFCFTFFVQRTNYALISTNEKPAKKCTKLLTGVA